VKHKTFCIFLILHVQVFLLSGFFVPPTFAQKATVNLKKYKVEILPLKKPIQKKYQLKLVHPYSFQLKTIQKSLVALKFKQKNILNVKKGRIFNNDLVKRLAPLIQDKFTLVNSNQRVSFKIYNASRKLYLQGDTFLTSEGLNWRFTALRGIKWGIEDFSVSGEPWILVLQKGQAYKQRYWRGSSKVAQDITNWLIFDKILPTASRKLTEPTQNRLPLKNEKHFKIPTASEVKKRLDLLDQLREENIITEKEFIDKRRGILGQL
jgi:hypothetical protein